MRSRFARQEGSAAAVGLAVVALILYVILLIPLVLQTAGWYYLLQPGREALESAARIDRFNDTYPYLLGRLSLTDMREPSPDKAIAWYRRSLALNPLQSGAWADLSRAYLATGDRKDAEHALERAVSLSPGNANLMWDAGTFWLASGSLDKAFAAFRNYLLIEPDSQALVYDLSWKVQPDNAFILKNLVPENYAYRSKYLGYLISVRKTDEAQQVWKLLDLSSLEKKDFIAYVDFLIAGGLYDEAMAVWKEITAKMANAPELDSTSLVWNQSFEAEPLNGGYGWRIREAPGVNVFLDEAVHMTGKRSLGVLFDGKQNPDVAFASQVVPVTPGAAYHLRGSIKTDGLTTTNGIFYQVTGHNCPGLDKRSEVMTGTSFWREVTLDFEAPAACRAVVVAARRERSAKLDNKIEGTAWIDGIALRQQAQPQTNSSPKR